jgi:hypothetical protein
MSENQRSPYAHLPAHAFWRRAVGDCAVDEMDPVVDVPFTISRQDRIATAGSCFAQHISRALRAKGFCHLVTEHATQSDSGSGEGSEEPFSARYGNIYTARQLLQLFERAYGLFVPADAVWSDPSGSLVDPFRPRICPGGFATRDALDADREMHMAAVRRMFEQCDVFVFTLGLTETWISNSDGAVVPLPPGVEGWSTGAGYSFHNLDVNEVTGDLDLFVDRLRTVNRNVRLIFTVSPVPLVATYEKRHVLVSNTYSKSVLRVAADSTTRRHAGSVYFPSYELVAGHQSGHRYFGSDLRSVTEEGVARVMAVFGRHFLSDGPSERAKGDWQNTSAAFATTDLAALEEIVCEEELLDR